MKLKVTHSNTILRGSQTFSGGKENVNMSKERRKSLTPSQKYAHKANQREKTTCDLSFKAIEEQRNSTLERHERMTDAYHSKLEQYSAALSKPVAMEGATVEAPTAGLNEEKTSSTQTPSQMYLSRRRWSTAF